MIYKAPTCGKKSGFFSGWVVWGKWEVIAELTAASLEVTSKRQWVTCTVSWTEGGRCSSYLL